MLLLILTFIGLFFTAIGESFLPLVSVWVLGLIWILLPYRDSPGLIVVPLSVSFQWLQITFGIFYVPLTGIQLRPMEVDYVSFVGIGLASMVALASGINQGYRVTARWARSEQPHRALHSMISFRFLLYFNLILLYFKEDILSIIWMIPALTQPLYAIFNLKIGVLFLVVFGFIYQQKYGWVWVVVGLEVGLNFTGYFADFRISLMVFFVALLDSYVRSKSSYIHKRILLHLSILLLFTAIAGTVWTGIKSDWRTFLDYQATGQETQLDKLSMVADIIEKWRNSPKSKGTGTAFGNRIWDIYHASLVIQRVPDVVPHEDGALLMGAIRHILMPRFLFPDKPVLLSESYKVRKYAGVMVAGGEGNKTNHSFSYITESYVDFGMPLMLVPIFAFGMLFGAALGMIQSYISDYYFKIIFILALSWTSLGRFETSWTKLLGMFGTMLIYALIFYFFLRLFTPSRQKALS
ncbi:hypothetical protein Mmc1_3485 [Magnetococcus marinus MC-1]|uniref:O-antigen polymerase n=1 Tax=Magnetococcus marinus (strain ATCC BAA-1437 / JCM 17883 / MC-1) TaxID=156889 RepID=A0LDC7_MAGMM|nr:hypothetical protein [Magnetococcus marinus]ABK45970.1 hypothetical protein Mmc1_3485 [Magnetococcus marinus MC-1]